MPPVSGRVGLACDTVEVVGLCLFCLGMETLKRVQVFCRYVTLLRVQYVFFFSSVCLDGGGIWCWGYVEGVWSVCC